MKISCHFLLTTGFALGASLLANSQSLFPSSGTPAPVQQYLFTPKQPHGSIWQPLRPPLITQSAPTRANATIYLPSAPWREKNKSRPVFPAELPALEYEDLLKDDGGRLHLPVLSRPGNNATGALRPDNMPCLVPNLARLESIPVDRHGNADPINRMRVPTQVLSGHKKRAM